MFIKVLVVEAQSPFEQIVKAENSFEKMCLDSGIKKGFLYYSDSSAVAFSNKGIENAKYYWKSLPDFYGIYSWAPSYAEISVSGDWGYTTGSVEYRDSLLNEEPSSYSQYTTVWYRNKEGDWKYLADIGNVHGPQMINRIPNEIKVVKVPVKNVTKELIINLENSFTKQFITDATKAMKKNYGKVFVLNLKGHTSVTDLDTAIKLLKIPSQFLKYKPLDIKISPKGDMALVYGNLYYKESKDFYMRIWRHESSGWKIALEVARIKF